jgi:5'-deoxynucleotidase YfbR-like HD superfamily hydrolase
MMLRLPETIDTHTGKAFNYNKPEVCAADVAHGLAYVCRFAGHVSRYMSVAEHSIIVSRLAASMRPELALAALWHDAHEAYMGDMPKPLKNMVGKDYTSIAAKIDEAIAKQLKVPALASPIIKSADNLAVLYEARELKPNGGWAFTKNFHHEQAEACVDWKIGLSPEAAESFFLNENYSLGGPT